MFVYQFIRRMFSPFQPKTKRKFIDKKNAVTFHLVHRSQKDPLITDENAPQHVLLETKAPLKAKEVSSKSGLSQHFFYQIFHVAFLYLAV